LGSCRAWMSQLAPAFPSCGVLTCFPHPACFCGLHSVVGANGSAGGIIADHRLIGCRPRRRWLRQATDDPAVCGHPHVRPLALRHVVPAGVAFFLRLSPFHLWDHVTSVFWSFTCSCDRPRSAVQRCRSPEEGHSAAQVLTDRGGCTHLLADAVELLVVSCLSLEQLSLCLLSVVCSLFACFVCDRKERHYTYSPSGMLPFFLYSAFSLALRKSSCVTRIRRSRRASIPASVHTAWAISDGEQQVQLGEGAHQTRHESQTRPAYLDVSPRQLVLGHNKLLQVHILRRCHLACVDLENAALGLDVRQRELDLQRPHDNTA
jgi:hypothetical protein